MTIDRIMFTKTFQVGLSNWEKVGMEASLHDGDIYEDCLSELKKEVEQFHRNSNPQLYKNGNEALVSSFGVTYTPEQVRGMGNSFTNPPVINRQHEKLEIQIDNCKSLDELAQFKDGLPVDLRSVYVNKARELTEKLKTNA